MNLHEFEEPPFSKMVSTSQTTPRGCMGYTATRLRLHKGLPQFTLGVASVWGWNPSGGGSEIGTHLGTFMIERTNLAVPCFNLTQ